MTNWLASPGRCGLLIFSIAALGFADAASAVLIWNESFNYSNGLLSAESGGHWVNYSGTDDMVVNSNCVELDYPSRWGDDYRALDQSYTSGNLYYGFSIKMSSIPSLGGTYFVMLGSGTSFFRARVFACEGTGSKYRLGISNGSTVGATWNSDLTLGVTYRVVVRADLDTDSNYLWVNPVNESSVCVTSTVASVNIPERLYLRQAAGIGVMTIDNLRVGTTFADVASPLATFTFRAFALTNNAVLRWTSPVACGLATNTVMLRSSITNYPDSITNGTLVYEGASNCFEHTGLANGVTNYYTIWVSDDGVTYIPPP